VRILSRAGRDIVAILVGAASYGAGIALKVLLSERDRAAASTSAASALARSSAE